MSDVQQDVRLLEGYGPVRMHRRRGRTGRNRKAPEALFDEISLEIAI